ncbi:MAG: DUF3140 domain-containing protein [Novosphingobium sp.]
MPLDHDKIADEFAAVVNMTAGELEKWLRTEESRSVGDKGEDDARESVGHASGRRITAILRKHKADRTEDDYAHMRKVVGYVHRHRAQQPADIVDSPWRYSLMNWGNDPLKGD